MRSPSLPQRLAVRVRQSQTHRESAGAPWEGAGPDANVLLQQVVVSGAVSLRLPRVADRTPWGIPPPSLTSDE